MIYDCPCGQRYEVHEPGEYACTKCGAIFTVHRSKQKAAPVIAQVPQQETPAPVIAQVPQQETPAPVIAQVPKQETPAPASTHVCRYCQSPMPDGALKCAHCGEWVIHPPSMLVYVIFSLIAVTGMLGFGEFYIGRKKTGYFFAYSNDFIFDCLHHSCRNV